MLVHDGKGVIEPSAVGADRVKDVLAVVHVPQAGDDAMPVPAQYIAEVLPATHFMRLIRGVFLRGAAVPDLMPDTLWLLGFTAVMLTIASKRFHKSLD